MNQGKMMRSQTETDGDPAEMSTIEMSPIWNILETHGVKLPDYITRLLQLTGYANLQSMSKLNDPSLIEELEHYTTENLDASDLGLPENKEKFYFNKETKKFCILPGHKHLIYDAAETVQKVLKRAEDEFHRDQQQSEGSVHSFSDFDTNSSNGKTTVRRKRDPSKPPGSSIAGLSLPTVEEERQSLTDYLTTWIARKVMTGQVEPFIYDVDYRINVFRPKNNGIQPPRPDIYSFVCLRCNTTLKAFKRANSYKWNTANVCRHLATVHCHPSLAGQRVNKRRTSKDRSTLLIVGASGSTPPLSDGTPAEQDPLD